MRDHTRCAHCGDSVLDVAAALSDGRSGRHCFCWEAEKQDAIADEHRSWLRADDGRSYDDEAADRQIARAS